MHTRASRTCGGPIIAKGEIVKTSAGAPPFDRRAGALPPRRSARSAATAALVLAGEDLVFATWDRRLHTAAAAEGLELLPATLD